MTYLWVIPVILLLVAAIWIFFLTVKHKGGSGKRQPGRTVHDETGETNPENTLGDREGER